MMSDDDKVIYGKKIISARDKTPNMMYFFRFYH